MTIPPLALLLSILVFACLISAGYSLASWVLAPRRVRVRHTFSATPLELGLILTLIGCAIVFALPIFVPGILAASH